MKEWDQEGFPDLCFFLSHLFYLIVQHNTCHYLTNSCVCSVPQLCLTLCDPTDCSPPASSVHRILQTRILEWVAVSSWDCPDPGIEPASSALAGKFLITVPPGKSWQSLYLFVLVHYLSPFSTRTWILFYSLLYNPCAQNNAWKEVNTLSIFWRMNR